MTAVYNLTRKQRSQLLALRQVASWGKSPLQLNPISYSFILFGNSYKFVVCDLSLSDEIIVACN
jgi:hypothetical protein